MEAAKTLRNDNRQIEVSVCCATYNHEKYIEQTLQSFVSQITDFRFEIIVHDDASTDATKKIIQKYVALYPDLFVPIYETENQYSKGYGVNLQIMFPKARGKYIALCEGDDYWIDDYKLQKQYNIMEKNPDCSICVCEYKTVWVNGRAPQKSSRQPKAGAGYGLQYGVIEKEDMAAVLWIKGGYPFHTSTYFFRKSVVDAIIIGKAEFMKYLNGDMTILRLCLLHGKFYWMEDVMSHRRKGVPGSWSERYDSANIQYQLAHMKNHLIGEKLFDDFSEHRFRDYIAIKIFNFAAECCIHDINESKNYKRYIKEFPLNIKTVHDKESLRIYIRYLIMRISPKLYYLLNKVQIKMIK